MTQIENQTQAVSILRNQPPLVNMLFIELLHQSIEHATLDSLSERDNSLAALDARLQAEDSTNYSMDPRSPLPTRTTRSTPFLTHNITIPGRQETPHWVSLTAQAEKFMLPKVQEPRPTRQANNAACADRLLLYLIIALIAIPNVVFSWAPMTIKLILGSAITIFFGYRLAVAFPVLTLLDPVLPLGNKLHRGPNRPSYSSAIRL